MKNVHELIWKTVSRNGKAKRCQSLLRAFFLSLIFLVCWACCPDCWTFGCSFAIFIVGSSEDKLDWLFWIVLLESNGLRLEEVDVEEDDEDDDDVEVPIVSFEW